MKHKSKQPVSKRKLGLKRFIGTILTRLVLIIFILIGLSLGVTTLQVLWLKHHNPKQTSWMKIRLNQASLHGKKLNIKYTWIEIEKLPNYALAAIIAAEDDNFFNHNGFDWCAIQKAWSHNEKKGQIYRGGSTISQQLAKNLYLSPERSYTRKTREAIITWLLEKILSKKRILEIYVNVIEFGPGIFGIEEGAKHHFRISADKLTLNQACRLAAVIPAPLRYKASGKYVISRAERIQRNIRPLCIN